MRGIFVIGTDTAVGKTFVTCNLVRLLSEKQKTGVMKPFECGPQTPSDHEWLWQASGQKGPAPQIICPAKFKAPQAPAQAASKEGKTVDLVAVKAAFHEICAQNDVVWVEGCGGLLVPLLPHDPGYTVENLALEFALPVLIVARAGLGTLNHTLLTVKRCAAVGLQVKGVVLNHPTPADPTDVSVRDNRKTLGTLCGVPVWGPLPYAPVSPPWEALKTKAYREVLEEVMGGMWAKTATLC